MVRRLFNRPGRRRHRLPALIWPKQNTGTVAPAEYQWGTHLAQTYAEEAGKSRVFSSVVAAAVSVGVLGAFVSAPQPAYAEPASFFQESVVSGQTTPVIRQLWAPPQSADFTLQATFDRPRPGPSLVRPFVGESVPADQTLPARIWRGAPGYQGPTVAPFVALEVPAELARPASVWSTLRTPPSTASAVSALVLGAQQPAEWLAQGWIWRAVPGYQGPTARPFSSELAQRDPTQQGSVWGSAAVVPSTGLLGKFIQGAPAPSDQTLQGWVQRAAPGYQGRTVVAFVSRAEAVDLTQQGLVVHPAVAPPATFSAAWCGPSSYVAGVIGMGT